MRTYILLFFFLDLFLLYSTTCALNSNSGEKKDPEVELCRKQCGRQPHFTIEEKAVCKYMCEEYGKEKADRQQRDGGASREEIERQRTNCKHQCSVSMLSDAEERRCEDRCEEQYWEEREKLEEEERKGVRKMLRRVVARRMRWMPEGI